MVRATLCSRTALTQRALQMFGVLEMSNEGGSDLDEQRSKFSILRVGNQSRVDSIKHGLGLRIPR
jgi:hypothetical protein